MSEVSIGEAAELLGVSADTVRRLCDDGSLSARRTPGGHRMVDTRTLAAVLAERSAAPDYPVSHGRSARNRFPGLVTEVTKDGVAAKVDIRSGPHRIVSLMTREAADELGLEPGSLVVASVKATNVVVETPHPPPA